MTASPSSSGNARRRRPAASALLALCAACTAPAPVAPPAPAAWDAEPWPVADALFQRDPRWLGGDAVYSVDLGGDRILWLFGDSFVATSDRRDRRESKMVRNSLAVQQGRDPAHATLSFHWRTREDGEPAPFFAHEGEVGFWPLHGIRIAGGPLLLFQTRVRDTPGQGLGFAIDGWRLLCIDEPDVDPAQWRWREVTLPPTSLPVVAGTAAWREGDHVMALGTLGHGPHRGLLCRMALAELRSGSASMQWWDAGRWVSEPPASSFVLDDAGPECSLHRLQRGWLHVYSRGFGATTVAVHTAAEVSGPWSAPCDVLTPPEAREERPFVYAAKAHPALDAERGWLAISYATNSFDFAQLFSVSGQQKLYWPRFWRVRAR
ncbi:MAG TPA: hypothetical protein VF384_18920 [Planctomycetota bacterium]